MRSTPRRQARQVLKRRIQNPGVLCVLAVKTESAKSAKSPDDFPCEARYLASAVSLRGIITVPVRAKKVENHEAAIALHYMYYNFARIHQSLRVTPAMEVGISDHVWSLEEIAGLLP
jgi:hypothetical protein